LNSLTSLDAKRGYRHAIDEFVDWYCSEPRLALNRIVVLRYRSHLESRQLAPGTVNLRLGAVRWLAYEAADCGLLSADLAAGIRRSWTMQTLSDGSGNAEKDFNCPAQKRQPAQGSSKQSALVAELEEGYAGFVRSRQRCASSLPPVTCGGKICPLPAVLVNSRRYVRRCMKRALISMAVLSVLVGLPSAAQNSISSGAIVGRVRDPSGAFVRGAVVTAIDNETAIQFDRVTNSAGLYSFPLMKVGRYTVRVRHDSFKTAEDFQVFPQPDPNPAFPLAGQYPNRYSRIAPRLGFA
jgi:hypothetical protein